MTIFFIKFCILCLILWSLLTTFDSNAISLLMRTPSVRMLNVTQESDCCTVKVGKTQNSMRLILLRFLVFPPHTGMGVAVSHSGLKPTGG